MSNLFSTTVIKGNRLTDFANTTATVGIPIPFGYGAYVTEGNVTWAPLPPKEHVKRQSQGGKGGGVEQETYTYTMSYAVAFCKGPINGFLWIKRNGKIVYTTDPNAPIEDKNYATKWLQKATLYYGTRDQLPDSTIESYEGTGQVSAFRDIAYIVVEDDDVTDGGGAVPSYEACVIANGLAYLTTTPYRLESTEAFSSSTDPDADVRNTSNITGTFEADVGVAGIEVISFRIVEENVTGAFDSDVQVDAIQVELMRIVESNLTGTFDADTSVASIEIEEIRVVLDDLQETKFTTDTTVTSIEVIVP